MRALTALVLLLTIVPAEAYAKTYSAERYDSRIVVQPDGSLDVTETVVFRFEDGSFTYVYREIPRRRTDGIEVVSAEMDGVSFPRGKEPGQVEVRRDGGGRVDVRWHFAPRQGTTHSFVVRYIARGVVRRANGADLLEWNALPVDHSYRIDSSTIVIEYPAAAILQGKPSVKSNRVAFAEAGVQQTDRQVQVTTSRIEKDGWVLPSLRFPEGSVISSPPAWQARELRAQAFAPRWATAAVIVFAVGVLVIVIFRRPYEKPPDQWTPTTHGGTLPDTLRPAVAGALSSSGRVGLEHAMATLFGLADRGDLTIVEEPKKWGQRQFNVTRLPGATPRHPEEAVLLDAAFKNKGNDETTVPLVKARTRIAGKLRDFKAAIHRELGELGLLDDERKRARSRYAALGGMLLALAALLIIPAAFLAGEFDGWPFLVVVAAGAAAIVSFIAYGALTPLSNEGWRRAHAWRGYRKYLQNVARGREPLAGDTPQRLLAYAVALNLAAVWSKFVKKHPSVVPPWYQSLAASGADDSFPAFIAYGGAADGGGNGGAGGGGGAAGGGGSGAG